MVGKDCMYIHIKILSIYMHSEFLQVTKWKNIVLQLFSILNVISMHLRKPGRNNIGAPQKHDFREIWTFFKKS